MRRDRFHPTPALPALALLLLTACQQTPDGALRPSFDRLNLDTAAPQGADRLEQPAAPDLPGKPAAVIVRGGGAAPRLDTADLKLSDEPTLTISFTQDSDLRQVTDTILKDILGLTYVYDPRVAGQATIVSGRPVSEREALGLLESVLRMNGAGLVRSDGVFRVVPIAEARQGSGGPVSGSAETGGFAVSVLPLRYVSAATVQQLVEPIYQASGSIVADPNLNLLLVAGTSDERRTILDAARAFDVDWMKGRSVGIFPLERSQPEAVINELRTIFAAAPNGPGAGAITFLPIQRLNAVLAVANQPAWLDEVAGWVRRLDQGEAGTRNLFVYSLQHAKARDVARILAQLFGAEGGGDRDEAVAAPGREERRLSFGGQTGGGAMGGAAGAGGARLGTPGTGQAGEDAGPGPGGAGLGAARIAATGGGAVEPEDPERQPPGGVRIIADPQNNALVVYAFPEEYRLIEQALRRLDVAPLQVLIEATIAEVSLTDELRYGVQSFFRNNSGDLFGGFTLNQTAVRPVTQVPGFNLVLARNGDPRAVLTALDEITDVRVVSSPQLVVLDNQEASLLVGDKVPVVTRTARSVTNPDAPLVNDVEYIDTGVILGVVPRISQGGMVTMEVSQEVSNVSETRNSGTLTPTISQRVILSNVSVRSGQTVVLGGLISDRSVSGSSGVPVLSRIPVLGGLFSQKTQGTGRTELIVFITPRIIRNPNEAQAVTEELMGRIRALNPAVRVEPGAGS